MTLIKSISGIRGTIGGKPGEGLNPADLVKFTAGYAKWLTKSSEKKCKVVVGRDARISGEMVNSIVVGTLTGCGIDVLNVGMATTPTVEIMVTDQSADGGIILTASHNPAQWNALKLLNSKGEFLDSVNGEEVLRYAEEGDFSFADAYNLGREYHLEECHKIHIKKILDLPYVNLNAIRKANLCVAIDCVNSVGGIVIPQLLMELGVEKVIPLYCDANGKFPHNPEPLPEHLADISEAVKIEKADVGFVVDPDVDRLAIINEDGSMFGEEYTLVAVSDYMLKHRVGNTVSNLSSTLALRRVTEKAGGKYNASAVGEVNVVEMMKKTNAVIGGEGNGGVILPDLHYGRDALVGIALFLSHMATSGKKCSELRKEYPSYFISKNKIELSDKVNVDDILEKIRLKFSDRKILTIDGVKVEFDDEWVHLRKSNTEPIIRIYAESRTGEKAAELAEMMISSIKQIIG